MATSKKTSSPRRGKSTAEADGGAALVQQASAAAAAPLSRRKKPAAEPAAEPAATAKAKAKPAGKIAEAGAEPVPEPAKKQRKSAAKTALVVAAAPSETEPASKQPAKKVAEKTAAKTARKTATKAATKAATQAAAEKVPAKKVPAKKAAGKGGAKPSVETAAAQEQEAAVVAQAEPASKKKSGSKAADPKKKQASLPVAEAATPVEPAVTAEAPAAKATKGRKPRTAQPPAPPEVVDPNAAAAPEASPPPPPRFALQPGSAWLGQPLGLLEIASERRYELLLRGVQPGDAVCSCEAFARSADGHCEHVDFVLKQLPDEVRVQGWPEAHSLIWLRPGLRRKPRWQAGTQCPAALDQAMRDWLQLGPLQQADGLPALLEQARLAGHMVKLDAELPAWLAEPRDARQRAWLLGEACAAGPQALHELLKLPLALHQLEAALFAASAGRALLADDLGLGQHAQALATAALGRRFFGLERVLLLCAESAQGRWLEQADALLGEAQVLRVWGDGAQRAQQWQSGDAVLLKIAALNSLEQDLAAAQAWAPQLVIVDEALRLSEAAAGRLAQLPAESLLLLSSQLPEQAAPQALLQAVSLLDPLRTGALAALHKRHLRQGADGQWLPLVAPAQLAQSLERVMLARSRAELPLPPALVQLRSQPLSIRQQTLQAPLLMQLRGLLARWQRSPYLSDGQQRQLLQQLQALRRLAISPALLDAAEAVASPRLDAVGPLARELLGGAAVDKLIVFSQWDDALALLAQRLQEQGLVALRLDAQHDLAQRQQQLRTWREPGGASLLLCSDAAALGLDLAATELGLINLELPYSEAMLEQRLERLSGEGVAGVPMVQLLAASGLEQGLLRLQDSERELPACGLDRADSTTLLDGPALQDFMQMLADWLALIGS